MPSKNRRRTELFKLQHPFCCFCGGTKETEQIDHIPPRAVFAGKIWPEGYAFPACAECNQGSRQVDHLAALLSQLSVADTNVSLDEFQRYRDGIANNSPSALPQVPTSKQETEAILHGLGVALPGNEKWEDVPLVLIDAKAFRTLDLLVAKIFCALHYKHVQQVVPSASRLMATYTSNQILSANDPFSWQKIPIAQNGATVARSGRDLRDQFDYFWGYRHGLFAVAFQIRHSIFGTILGPIGESEWARVPSELQIYSSKAA